MEATIIHVDGGKNGVVRTTYQADDEHTLASRIQAAIDEADADGRDVKVMLDEQVATLMEARGYVSFVPTR